MARSWTRRGEWVETALPAKTPRSEEDEGRREAEDLGAVTAAGLEISAAAALGVPEKLARRLLHAGEMQVRGGRVRLRLRPDEDLGFEPVWTEDGIEALYEDDFCLVVHKPAGMPVHPDGGAQRLTLANAVAAHYQMHGEACAVHHVHRLDEHTSGPVLYAKGELARQALDEQMRGKEIGRVYLAIVQGRVAPSLRVIDAPIGRDRHHNSRRRISPGGQDALTRVEVVETLAGGRASLVRLVLETGRTHQIRVHMAHAGHPLIGDTLYGGPADRLNRQALHGEKLGFRHPFGGEQIEISAPLPGDMEDLLDRLS